MVLDVKFLVLFQIGEIFLTSMGNWTFVLVISHCSLTRLPDASESRSLFSVTQPIALHRINTVTSAGLPEASVGLPPITEAFSTVSINAALTTLLSGSGLAISFAHPHSVALSMTPGVDSVVPQSP